MASHLVRSAVSHALRSAPDPVACGLIGRIARKHSGKSLTDFGVPFDLVLVATATIVVDSKDVDAFDLVARILVELRRAMDFARFRRSKSTANTSRDRLDLNFSRAVVGLLVGKVFRCTSTASSDRIAAINKFMPKNASDMGGPVSDLDESTTTVLGQKLKATTRMLMKWAFAEDDRRERICNKITQNLDAVAQAKKMLSCYTDEFLVQHDVSLKLSALGLHLVGSSTTADTNTNVNTEDSLSVLNSSPTLFTSPDRPQTTSKRRKLETPESAVNSPANTTQSSHSKTQSSTETPYASHSQDLQECESPQSNRFDCGTQELFMPESQYPQETAEQSENESDGDYTETQMAPIWQCVGIQAHRKIAGVIEYLVEWMYEGRRINTPEWIDISDTSYSDTEKHVPQALIDLYWDSIDQE